MRDFRAPGKTTRNDGLGRHRRAVRSMGVLAAGASLLALASAGSASAITPATTLTISPVTATLAGSGLGGALPGPLTAGPDGNVWFVDGNLGQGQGAVGRLTPSGVVTEFTAGITQPAVGSVPSGALLRGITSGPDGNVWFTEALTNKIGRITPTGTVTEFPINSILSTSPDPRDITAGPDGALWFVEPKAGAVGRITTTGTVSEFPVPTSTGLPISITTGPDGNLWVLKATTIDRLTPAGAVTEFALPSSSPQPQPESITAGADGNLWFTEGVPATVGKITTSGTVTTYPVPNGATSYLGYITPGPDGNLWTTEYYGPSHLESVTPAGTITEYSAGTGVLLNNQPYGITSGPDGRLWFSTQLAGAPPFASVSLTGLPTQSVTATVNAGVLGVSLSSPTVAFGALNAGQTTSTNSAGLLTVTNSLGDGLNWTATVAATDLVSGVNKIPASNLTLGATLQQGNGTYTGPLPSAPAITPFAFTGCSGPGDAVPGFSYSCPVPLLSGGGTSQGAWSMALSMSLKVPQITLGGSYHGSVLYDVTG